jgi:hypothetical protein
VITADTITDEQIRELQGELRRDLDKLSGDPQFWTSHLRKAIVETDWALAVGEPLRTHLARARCAEILNARAEGK